MNKSQKTIFLITINSLLSLSILMLLYFLFNSFSLASFVSSIELHSKRFALYFLAIFVILILSSKVQLNLVERFKESKSVSRILKWTFIVSILFFNAILIGYLFQYFHFLMDPFKVVKWLEEFPLIYYCGIVLVFLLLILGFALFNNIFISSIVISIILVAIGFAHYNKLSYRAEPLYPTDFQQLGHLNEVIPMISDSFSWFGMIIVFLLLALVFIWVKYFPKMKTSLWIRLPLIIVSSLVIYSYATFPNNYMNTVLEKAGVSISKWNPINTYNHNGLLVGFLSNLTNEELPEPEGYSKDRVLEIANKYLANENTESAEIKPNIVFIMNEAFWDPTRLENVEFSEDPLENIRGLMSEHSFGNIYSPAFGGATANIEFEALTGFTTAFVNPGSIPYQELIDNKPFVPSIVFDLEKKGYNTLAIHPYNKAFYKRTTVYNTFGIDRFLDEDTMKYQERSGPMISDESVSKEIFDEISTSDTPMFIHAVTMQNHLPYHPGRYQENTMDVTGLSPESNAELEVYAEGVKQADEALQYLIDKLEPEGEPTIIVFWGDHLPSLGQNRSVYNEANFADTSSHKLNDRRYSETPLLIYTNFLVKSRELQTISPIYLGPIVYDLVGFQKPPYYRLLDKIYSELPGIKANVKIGSDQFLINELTDDQKLLLEEYRLIQYDLLAGKGYSMDLMYPE